MKQMRRLARVQLDTSVSDSKDRNIMPMSTLIGIDEDPPNYAWLLEATWDGSGIGDVQVYRNKNVSHDDNPKKDAESGMIIEPEWVWWCGVPSGKIKNYKFAASEIATLTPSSVDLPFNPDAQREEKSRQTQKGSGQARA